ncbi:acetyltransferase [Paeniglutamicibacter gangotriensis]|uniref:Acetyltransferase n=1 Tax=Paeniglutamicibacter gangotriensis TaxID=254787 RepID=A0A5B0EFU6_9MICC|nr:NeuD/PglB/VioB family sugar acetyltransferase [Paeniglutamicibacter gangotriensis]KAA0977546.1 acetyltransferase [Paeniglutamicibacter gangotriensis]
MAKVLLLTASGLAREVIASIAQSGDHQVVGLLDDNEELHGSRIGGVSVLGGLEMAVERDEQLLICAGKGSSRAAIAARLGLEAERYATHIHPTFVRGERTVVGYGSIILAGCVATCDVEIGRHCVLMPRVTLTHDNVLGDFATMAAGVTLGGRVIVGQSAYLGMNASVKQDLSIGPYSILGMGAVLLKNLPASQIWAGNPARSLAEDAPTGAHAKLRDLKRQEATS